MKVLYSYKGKRDPKDLNKYRGIALEHTPFKKFTKIITIKMQETLDEHLPETRLGFKKGRSSITAVDLLLNNIWEALEREGDVILRIHTFIFINSKLVTNNLEEMLNKNNTNHKINTTL